MITASRIISVAAIAVAAIACSSAPEADETVSVDIDTDQLDPTCIKRGTTCGPLGQRAGGAVKLPTGGMAVNPGPSSGSGSSDGDAIPPNDCGSACRWNDKLTGCECGGAGYGLISGVVCSTYSYPCPRNVYGTVRCYRVSSDGYCH